MNLILSDVEETIMIVEVAEGAPEGHGTVNVLSVLRPWIAGLIVTFGRSQSEKWTCCSSEATVLSWYANAVPTIFGLLTRTAGRSLHHRGRNSYCTFEGTQSACQSNAPFCNQVTAHCMPEGVVIRDSRIEHKVQMYSKRVYLPAGTTEPLARAPSISAEMTHGVVVPDDRSG
jgi:hypothetical protein